MPTDRWRLGVCKKKLRIAKMVRVGSWKEPTWGARKLVCWDLRSAFWLSSGQKKLVMIKKKNWKRKLQRVCVGSVCVGRKLKHQAYALAGILVYQRVVWKENTEQAWQLQCRFCVVESVKQVFELAAASTCMCVRPVWLP